MSALSLSEPSYAPRGGGKRTRAGWALVLVAATAIAVSLGETRAPSLDHQSRAAFTRIARDFASKDAYGDAHPSASVYPHLPLEVCAALRACGETEGNVDDPVLYFLVLSGDFTCYACPVRGALAARLALQHRFPHGHTIVVTAHRYGPRNFRVTDVGMTGRTPPWSEIGPGIPLP